MVVSINFCTSLSARTEALVTEDGDADEEEVVVVVVHHTPEKFSHDDKGLDVPVGHQVVVAVDHHPQS
ncbi:MAG: hypothetical protein WCI00_07165 [bacterium]